MERSLRVLIALTAVLIVAATSFLMGFGTSYLVTSLAGQASAAASTARLTPTPTPAPAVVRDVQQRSDLLWAAVSHVVDAFYDQAAIDAQKLVHGAVRGMVDSLGDPNSYFAPPEQVKMSRDDLEGTFEGIGATIEKKAGRLLIVAPIADTPAHRAGLKPGDWIVKIDGKDTSNLSAGDGAALIRGPKGTAVTLTIVREGIKDPFDVTIVRDVINTPNVRLTMLEDNIARVQLINVFSSRMAAELRKALQDARSANATKIILDMRGNPGGYLDTSIQVASEFLKEGVVAYRLDRDGKRTAIPVIRGGVATDLPLVVLVNKGSASATEIVAAAIQDTGRGILIGETTFGKGTVQQDFALSDGSALHLTIAHWLTPRGRDINEIGLRPDIEVKLTDEDVQAGRDPQLERAIQYLKTGQ